MSSNRGGSRPGSGRKPEPGFIIRPAVRLTTGTNHLGTLALKIVKKLADDYTTSLHPVCPYCGQLGCDCRNEGPEHDE